MLGWLIRNDQAPIKWGYNYVKERDGDHVFKELGNYLIQRPYARKAESIQIARYVKLSSAEKALAKLNSQVGLDIGIILEHDERHFGIASSSFSNTDLTGKALV